VVVDQRAWVGSSGGDVLALDLETGQPSWKFETGSSITASPSIADGRLVIGTLDGELYCFGTPAERSAGDSGEDHD